MRVIINRPPLEGLTTKAKEGHSLDEVKLSLLLDTCL